jgi:hypothetical protein
VRIAKCLALALPNRHTIADKSIIFEGPAITHVWRGTRENGVLYFVEEARFLMTMAKSKGIGPHLCKVVHARVLDSIFLIVTSLLFVFPLAFSILALLFVFQCLLLGGVRCIGNLRVGGGSPHVGGGSILVGGVSDLLRACNPLISALLVVRGFVFALIELAFAGIYAALCVIPPSRYVIWNRRCLVVYLRYQIISPGIARYAV